MLLKTCIQCGSEFSVRPYREKSAKFCSSSCNTKWKWKNKVFLNNRNQLKGSEHKMWKGGVKKLHGYVLIYSPNHPNKDKQGYVREHRLVVEREIGRYLMKDEVIHHKNGLKNDNRLLNLEVISNQEHSQIHQRKRMEIFRKLRIEKKCPNCGKDFSVPQSLSRIKTCSKSCGAYLRNS